MAKENESKPIDVQAEEVKAGEGEGLRLGGSFLSTNVIYIGVAVVVLGIAAFLGWKYYNGTRNQEAAAEIFAAEYYFEKDSLDKALKGDGEFRGFMDIADDYKGTPVGDKAAFQAGVVLMRQGQFETAIDYLNQFRAGDQLVQARSYCLIGDCYLELENPKEAANYYSKAADYRPNEQFTPTYLMKLALAYELQKEYKSAFKTYEKLINQYPRSSELTDAKKYKGKVSALMTE
jgi:tetratricopeptide (TPR) repeat protein